MNDNIFEVLIKPNKGEDVCLCGHFKNSHDIHEYKYCTDCLLSLWISLDNVCKKYKRDNLKYLEAKEDSKCQ